MDEDDDVDGPADNGEVHGVSSDDSVVKVPIANTGEKLWEGVKRQHVNNVLHDIDGLTVYKIAGNDRTELLRRSKYGRRWKCSDSSTKWTGYLTVR